MKKLTPPSIIKIICVFLLYIGIIISAFQSTLPEGLAGFCFSLFVAVAFGYLFYSLVEDDLLKSRDDYPIHIAQKIDLARENYLSLMVFKAIEKGYVENDGKSVLLSRANYVGRHSLDRNGKRMILFHHKALRIAAKSQKLNIIQKMSLAKDIHQDNLCYLPQLSAHDIMHYKAQISHRSLAKNIVI